MKRILITLLIIIASLSAKAQTFTFECICDYVTLADSNCDICTTTGIQSRLFKGLLIRKNGNGYKWIDQPYIIQIQNNNATFRELIPNGETVTIGLLGTPYDTMPDYKAAIKCPCAGTEAIFVAGPGINISGDTISAVDTSASNELQYIDTFRIVGNQLQISLSNDSLPYLFVTLPTPDGSETIVTAGTGIGVTGNGTTGTPYIVTNTGDLSATNEGLLGVGAGGASSSVILSNTSGAVGVTVNVTGIATISESTSANGGSITIGAVEVDGSVTNEAWTIDADDADTELITTQTVKFQGGGIVVTDYIPGTDILTITGTEVDGSTSNEVQTISASGAGPTSYNIDLNLSGGSVTLAEGTNTDITRSGNTLTINNTGAAALSGVVNQLAWFNTTTTITTEVGSGNDAVTWNPTTNRMGIHDTAPASDLTISNSNSASTGGIRLYEGTDAASYWNIWVGGGGNYDGYLNFTNAGTFIMNMDANGTQFFKGLYMNENDGVTTTGVYIRPIQHGNSYIEFFRAPSSTDGILRMAAWGHLNFVTGSNSNAANVDLTGRWGLNLANASIARQLDVNGEVRIRDLATDPPTQIVGADADGDLGVFSLSGLSISGGTLTATDGSVTNEGVLGVGVGGASSSTLLSTTSGANAVTINVTGILTITESASANGGSITLGATEVDGSVSNEGVLGVGAGGAASSTLLTTTSGGNAVTINVTGALSITESTSANGGSITINGTGIDATTGYIKDGNSFGGISRIGLNDNFDLIVETNGTDRMWFDNGGAISIGATQLTTAALNINGLLSSQGMLIAGGGSLSNSTFYSATGSGTGSNIQIVNGTVSMLNGNVEAFIQNSSASGTGGALYNVSTKTGAGDPGVLISIDGVQDWKIGIDNSAADRLMIQPNSTLGSAAPGMTILVSGFVGINQAVSTSPVQELQVTGTGGIGFPRGTTAQRLSSPTIPIIRANNEYGGTEIYDPSKGQWYRYSCTSSPTVTVGASAGTGATAGLVSGAGSNDVCGKFQVVVGSASIGTGTYATVTFSFPYDGTTTIVTITPANDNAMSDGLSWRVDTQTNTAFTLRATGLSAGQTYQFNYSVRQ